MPRAVYSNGGLHNGGGGGRPPSHNHSHGAAYNGGANNHLECHTGVNDMCLLEQLDEESFIENLKERFYADQIYTYIGNVVISVNPYKKLPIYTSDTIYAYRSRNIYELAPHIYAISDEAYRSMRDHNMDQCVIISGESGSGKTEASKVIMQFVAQVSGKGAHVDRVKEQLLQSNPVLEAFGNAKTHRNDNSSRFGKYMDIEFDFKGDPIGGVITNYLLEKSRVAGQTKGERSFHIFYQLLSGADTSFIKTLRLQRNPENYQILKSGLCSTVDSIDDKEGYAITTHAMKVIGFEDSEIIAVFQLVASVLKLGNVNFRHQNNYDGTDGCRLQNEDEVHDVCELLQCDTKLLLRALKQRTLETGGGGGGSQLNICERVKTDLSATEASYARDALCKALYNRLFTWIIHRINDSIKVKVRGRKKCMGVLDIYGFEIFEKNSFEQFIINYCNEKLQQIFIELTLKEEQEEYISEGIEWVNVEYFNNAVICSLIEDPSTGILAMLDEECLRPGKVTDETFLHKLETTCHLHKHYESRGCKKSRSDHSLPHHAFRLVHYAGAVTYNIEGFIDKNNDLLYRDLSRAMYKCEHPLMKALFPEGNPQRTSRKRPATAGSQFKTSVSELMKNLSNKCPNYIRCIKPNDYKKSHYFDDELVRHQVGYLGLLENVRVRRAGYAYRQVYEIFLYRYKMLSQSTWPSYKGHPLDGVQCILDDCNVHIDEYSFGKTKVFIRNPRTLFTLEDYRSSQLHVLATLIQKTYRCWITRQRYLILRHAQIIISSRLRGYQARRKYQRIQAATLVFCRYARGWKARKLARQLRREKLVKWATGVIQAYYRGWKARCLARRLAYHKRCVWAVGVIHKYYKGWVVRKEYRAKFRAIAGPKVVRFLKQALCVRFLLLLYKHLPTASPADKRWPMCSNSHRQASDLLRDIHHKWRCRKYRAKCDQACRNQMREKVTASDLFKGRKANYPRSVPHPFKGDYVRLQQNLKWQKLASEMNDLKLVFADIIMKVNRKNGKMIPQLLVLSSNAMLVLDQRTLAIKYRIPTSEFQALSLSPYSDRLAVFHLKKRENGDILTKKGDFIISSDHIHEIVAKLYLLIVNTYNYGPQVHIATHMETEMNGHHVEISFRTGIADVAPGTVKIVKKGNKVEVLQS